jgi:uncharacterized protein GlcG (DUF336 family)
MPKSLLAAALLAAAVLFPPAARAQMQNGYGPSIGAEAAKKAIAAALAEARKNSWRVAAAVVDPGGALVAFERIDDTQAASMHVAVEKARSSVAFKRPTKAFEDALVGGRQAILGLPGAVPLEGGIPILADGKIIGAIGVSGATSQQDGVCAQAGVAALEPKQAAK